MSRSIFEVVGSQETRPEALATLRDNARQASTDKERGDRWVRSHGCVVSLPNKTSSEDYGTTVFLPAEGKRYVAPYTPDPTREMAFSRHATGSNPRVVIALVNEIERLRQALSTTPARAEAQDEGAAGEPVAKVVRKGFSTGLISWTKFGQDADLSDETPLYAHPSPTPAAADADRVRIAVEALEDISAGRVRPSCNEPGLIGRLRERATEALAALKSTAAKEGGE